MINIVYKTGMLVVTVILYAIPILTACSFIYDWGRFFQVVLIGASMTEYYIQREIKYRLPNESGAESEDNYDI